jgi:hypothetical protein
MALVVRVHFLKAPARNVVVKEPREKKMRAIKDEVFSSLSRQFKGEPSDYEAFLHHPRRVLAGVVGDDPAEDTTASTRDESSPRPPASSAVVMCWLRDDEYLPLPDGVRPKVLPPPRSIISLAHILARPWHAVLFISFFVRTVNARTHNTRATQHSVI